MLIHTGMSDGSISKEGKDRINGGRGCQAVVPLNQNFKNTFYSYCDIKRFM
jgi:hypothetical protein